MRQVGETEPGQTRPEPDVAGWRILGLKPGDLLENARERKPRAVEQELAREQRPVQVTGGQNARPAQRDLAKQRSQSGYQGAHVEPQERQRPTIGAATSA